MLPRLHSGQHNTAPARGGANGLFGRIILFVNVAGLLNGVLLRKLRWTACDGFERFYAHVLCVEDLIGRGSSEGDMPPILGRIPMRVSNRPEYFLVVCRSFGL